MARQNPPHHPAWQVSREIPLLWNEELAEKKKTPGSSALALVREHGSTGIDNGIIAVVGKRIITLKEFDAVFFESLRSGQSPSIDLYHRILDSMIEQMLMLEEAERLEFKIEDSEVEERFEAFAEKAGGYDLLVSELQKNQQSVETFKRQVRESMLVSQLERQWYAGMIQATPQEVMEYYRKNIESFSDPEKRDVSIILVFNENYPNVDKARETLSRVAEKLGQGAEFDELARQFSEEPGAEKTHGRKPWVSAKDMAGPISRVAFSLPPGKTSELSSWDAGFFLVRCHEVRAPGVREYSSSGVQEEIRAKIRQQKLVSRRALEAEKLRKKAYIEKLDPKVFLDYRNSL